jgi:hypothetical protein
MGAKSGEKKARDRAARRQQETVRTVAAGRDAATREFGFIAAIGAAFCLGAIAQWDLINEAWANTGWYWVWRDLGVAKTAALLLPALLLIMWAARTADRQTDAGRAWVWVTLLALANYLLQVGAMLCNPQGFEWLRAIVYSPMATSYFADARAIRQPIGWLSHFHQIGLGVHSSTHPPGPILFYYAFINIFGVARGALLGGCAVGLLGSAGVFVMYLFSGLWTADVRRRIACCSLYALIPALIVFFPEFDQVYPILSMLLILFSVRALRDNRLRDAVYAGAVLFAALFFAYNLLMAGVFVLYFAGYCVWTRRPVLSVARTGAIIAGVYIAAATALWGATGYNPIAAFRTALRKQGLLAAYTHRSYSAFVMMDPYDFLLGAGIIALPLLVFYLRRMWRKRVEQRDEFVLTVIGIATILTVDISGLLRAESARVWLFLQPLLIVPAGLELAGVDWRHRRWILGIQWLIVVCLQAKMSFVAP